MAVGVVDALEVVDVDRDDRQRALLADRARDLGVEALRQPAAVQQAGQGIDARLRGQARDEPLVARRQRPHDGPDDRGRDDDVDTSGRIVPSDIVEQRGAVGDRDGSDGQRGPARVVEVTPAHSTGQA